MADTYDLTLDLAPLSFALDVAMPPLSFETIMEAGIGPSVGGGYDFVQASAASPWTIAHNLGHYPVVELLTVGGARMLADVVHLSVNTLQVFFAAPTAGRARLV